MAQQQTTRAQALDDYPFDLGSYSRKISTESPDAQRWFDRGLNWIYGFNHDEAEACFKRALEFDPDCAMIYWALAYIAGPNYNVPWEFFDEQMIKDVLAKCRGALEAAERLKSRASAPEQALITALHKRFQSPESVPNLYVWSDAYAQAMEEVYNRFDTDPDVIALFADAMMNRTPWKLWDPRTGKPVDGADTLKTRQVLERGIALQRGEGKRHPGIWHLYIHCMEMSPTPEVALLVGDELRHLVPDSGHICHMPTHIDIQCGNYLDTVDYNRVGIERDMKFYHYAGGKSFYSLYRAHNYQFMLYGAMFLGQYEPAIWAARQMQKSVGDDVMTRETPMLAGIIDPYLSEKIHVLVRFGKWQECIDEPLPEDQELYTTTTAMTYYAKAIGYANLKNDKQAREMQAKFRQAVDRVPKEQLLHTVSCHSILAVGDEMLAGEIEYHAGNVEEGFAHLRKAVELEDNLPYDEPWPWMMPCRHALGALLLEQGQLDEAIDVYEADLGFNEKVIRANRHYNNIWALRGLHRAYTQAGRDHDARRIKPALDVAAARADRSIYASCFCSKKKAA